MLLKKLELEGLGPFIEKTEINFEELSFFCIQGENGSGKSTLIDAVFIALWGKTPKASLKDLKPEKSDRLRVFLSFEIDQKTIEVERIRGRGASDCLEVKKSNGEKESYNGAKEVTAFIENQLHLKQNVVQKAFLIRQGEFAQILESGKKEEREAILQMMVGDLFEKITDKITSNEQEYEKKALLFQSKWESFSLTRQDEKIRKLKEDQESFSKAIKQVEKDLETEQKLYEKLITLQNKYQNYKEVQEKIKRLNKEKDSNEKRKKELLKIEKAFALVGDFNSFLRMQKSLKDLEEEKKAVKKSFLLTQKSLKDQLRNLEELRLKKEKSEAVYEEFYDSLKQLAFQRARLAEDLVANKKLLKPKIEELADYKKGIEQETHDFQKLKNELFKALEVIKDADLIEKKVESFEANAKRFYEYQNLLKQERNLLKEQDSLTASIRNLSQKAKSCELEKEKLFSKLEKEKQIWLKNQVAIIRSGLGENEPCPVCGSLYHQTNEGKLKTDKRENDSYLETLNEHEKKKLEKKALDQERVKEEKLLEEKKNNIKSLKKLLKAEDTFFKEMNINVDSDYDMLFNNLKKQKALMDESRKNIEILSQKQKFLQKSLEDKKAQAKKMDKELSFFVEKNEELLKEGEKIKISIEALLSKAGFKEAVSQKIDTYLKKIKENKEGSYTNFSKQQESFVSLSSKLERQEEKLDTLKTQEEKSREDFKVFEVSFLKKLSEAEIEKEDVLKAEKYTKEELNQEFELIRSFFEQLKQLEIAEKEAQNEQLKDLSKELIQNKEKRAALNDELLESSGKLKIAAREEVQLIQEKTEYLKDEESQKENLKIQKSFRELKKDFQSSKFPAFFARLVLKRVIAKANKEFLTKVLGGRYLLLLDEKNDKLLVKDQDYKQDRTTETLSGGEKFLVSFALALSFSKIIGERIGMFFIDEGFGSLDQNNRVLLTDIFEFLNAEKSRKIGIITHVKEIADVISQKIFVIKEENGSKLEIQV